MDFRISDGTGWTTDLSPGLYGSRCTIRLRTQRVFGCDHHHLRSHQFYLSVYTTRDDELELQGLRRCRCTHKTGKKVIHIAFPFISDTS